MYAYIVLGHGWIEWLICERPKWFDEWQEYYCMWFKQTQLKASPHGGIHANYRVSICFTFALIKSLAKENMGLTPDLAEKERDRSAWRRIPAESEPRHTTPLSMEQSSE